MTEPAGIPESDVLWDVTNNLVKYEEKLKRPIFLFTYSVTGESDVHVFPKKIACSTTENGVWSKIDDDREIFESLTSYFLLFAIGLGVEKNENFTAWVEPYEFATGDVLGTTVSAPVYDRSKDPPLFLGVAGLDFSMAAVDKALEVEEGSQESINRIVLTSTARCPNIDLTLCEFESFRRRGRAGNSALCTSNCSAADFIAIEEEACGTVSDYLEDLWADRSYEDLSYLDRTCCKVGEDRPSDECPPEDDDANTAAIVGGVVDGVVGALAICVGCLYCASRRTASEDEGGRKNGRGQEAAMTRFDRIAAARADANAAATGQPAEPDIPVSMYSQPVFTTTSVSHPPPSAPPAENPKYVVSESDLNP